MRQRHDKLGIKQTIRKEWMDRVLEQQLAGHSETEIRQDLDEYLAFQKQSGGTGQRGEKTYRMAISVLASWFAPDADLLPFRDEAILKARESRQFWLPLHWAIICASYPFWFQVAKQVGRLLNLQDQITQKQIFNRLKEQYGDRETVARNARYTVRSFVAWGVLQDAPTKGCYIIGPQILIEDQKLSMLILEAALYANPEMKSSFDTLYHSPAFFPFIFPDITAAMVSHSTDRIEVARYGLDDNFLNLIKQESSSLLKQ